jgi:hypothetical protein
MFVNQLDEVISKYPKLYKHIVDNVMALKGFIDIIDDSGKLWDTYEILVRPSSNFPNKFPILFEIGGKIPKNGDWHIYTDGSCCLTVPPNEAIVCINGVSVLTFIDDWVLPYLANQTYRTLTGDFVNEYSHGTLGLVEFYQNLLNTKDTNQIVRLLTFILNNKKPDRTNVCFCGSNQKFRHCHKEAFEKINLIGEELVKSNLTSMFQYLAYTKTPKFSV